MAEQKVAYLYAPTGGNADRDVMDADNVWTRSEPDTYFYFDYVAANMGARIIREIGNMLNFNAPKIENIEKDQPNAHETSFRILFEWFNRSEKDDLENDFKRAFKAAGRQDILEMSFSKNEFKYKGDASEEQLIDADITFVSKRSPSFQRIVRYIGAGEDKITTAIADNPSDVKEQAYNVLLSCKRAGQMKSRKDLCDALNYTGNKKLIDDLEKHWASGSASDSLR